MDGGRRGACREETSTKMDPALWQNLPTALIALVISKLPILKLIRVVQKCGHAVKREVMDAPGPLIAQAYRPVECFFPTFFDKGGDGWMSAYNADTQTWSHMPELGFLPQEVNYILAGSGGLLCVTGGGQPRYRGAPRQRHCSGGGDADVPDHAQWDWLNFPGPQPILIVCNPLTRKQRLLPPMPAPLRFPVAHMEVAATHYALYVVGWDEPSDASVVTVYSSRSRAWTGWRAFNGLRPAATLAPGTNPCGLRDGGELWLGGERRWAGAWEPRILCFNLRREAWTSVLHWVPGCEPPRVVESGGCLYASTRLSTVPYTVYIFEVVGTCGASCPYSNFDKVATMPDDIYCFFFEGDRHNPAKLTWECRAGKGLLVFHNPRNGRLVWFHLRAHQRNQARGGLPPRRCFWGVTKTKAPHFEPGYTSMGNCLWHPSFTASV